jgi:hypothetical protein
LSTQGNRIVDETGRTMVLRGANVEGREWNWGGTHVPFYERRAIPLLTGAPSNGGWGANLVLLAVASGPIVRGEADYLNVLDELVALAKANGAYTLLVYRYDEPNVELVAMPDQEAEDAMKALALRYANEPAVLYGLQVEALGTSWSVLKPRFITMIDAIRSVNPRSLIFVPGTQWSRYIYWSIDSPIDRPNLVWKTHPYDSWSAIQNSYRLDQVSAQFPVLVGEFGPGSYMNMSDVLNLLNYAESKGMSWTGWLFQSAGCPCMFSSVSPNFVTNTYGEEIKNRLQAAYNGSRSGPVTGGVATPTISPNGGAFTDTLVVSLSTTTAGATIRYTINGGDPTDESAQYAQPFVVGNTATVKAKAFKTGMTDSGVASATFTKVSAGTVAAPVFNPNGGDFSSTVSVTLSTATANALIRYTTNGSDPTPASTQYTGAISLSATTTVKARAFLLGLADSPVASATFTKVTVSPVATPAFNPNGGDFSGTVSVTLSTATANAVIRYTTNGTDPSAGSSQYTGPISLSATTTLKARAFKSGMTDSAVATATFTKVNVTQVDTPTISPNGGNFNDSTQVTLSTTTPNATIRYTTNGSDPTGSSTLYSGPFTVGATTTVKARAFLAGMPDSAVATATFTKVTISTVAAPIFSSPGGTFTTSVTVTMSTSTAGATIRYTLDGTDPTSGSALYNAALTLGSTVTVKARAFKAGMSDSPVSSATFTKVTISTVATPNISPAGGAFTQSVAVTLTTATAGATIRYTTNGVDPTANSTLYSSPFPVTTTTTVKARAFKAGLTDSPVATAVYTKGAAAGNRKPVLNSIGNQSVLEGRVLSIPLSAEDPDGNVLTYSATGLPSFASLVNAGGNVATLVIAPVVGNRGAYSSTISVSDGSLTHSETISIVVNPAPGSPGPGPVVGGGGGAIVTPKTATVKVGAVGGNSQQAISVPVTLDSGNVEVRSFQVNLTYPKGKLLNPMVEKGEDMPNEWSFSWWKPETSAGSEWEELRLIGVATGTSFKSFNGPIAKFTFTLASDPNSGTVPLNVVLAEVWDSANTSLRVITIHGAVGALVNYGDVTGDGKLDEGDVQVMIDWLLGREARPQLGTALFRAADVDGDGVVGLGDINWAVDKIRGRITKFIVE